GLEANLVGISHECDYPPSVRHLPRCTAPRFAVEGGSKEIDQRVRELAHAGLSVYNVDGDLLRRLRPDVIVTQSQCEVFAVSARDVERAVGDLTGGPTRVVSLAPFRLADVWDDVRRVAEACGVASNGETLMRQLRERVDATAARAAVVRERPTV